MRRSSALFIGMAKVLPIIDVLGYDGQNSSFSSPSSARFFNYLLQKGKRPLCFFMYPAKYYVATTNYTSLNEESLQLMGIDFGTLNCIHPYYVHAFYIWSISVVELLDKMNLVSSHFLHPQLLIFQKNRHVPHIPHHPLHPNALSTNHRDKLIHYSPQPQSKTLSHKSLYHWLPFQAMWRLMTNLQHNALPPSHPNIQK